MYFKFKPMHPTDGYAIPTLINLDRVLRYVSYRTHSDVEYTHGQTLRINTQDDYACRRAAELAVAFKRSNPLTQLQQRLICLTALDEFKTNFLNPTLGNRLGSCVKANVRQAQIECLRLLDVEITHCSLDRATINIHTIDPKLHEYLNGKSLQLTAPNNNERLAKKRFSLLEKFLVLNSSPDDNFGQFIVL